MYSTIYTDVEIDLSNFQAEELSFINGIVDELELEIIDGKWIYFDLKIDLSFDIYGSYKSASYDEPISFPDMENLNMDYVLVFTKTNNVELTETDLKKHKQLYELINKSMLSYIENKGID